MTANRIATLSVAIPSLSGTVNDLFANSEKYLVVSVDKTIRHLDALVGAYLRECVSNGLAGGTVDRYTEVLTSFRACCRGRRFPTLPDAIAAWSAQRYQEVSRTTAASNVNKLRTFIRWLRRRGHIAVDIEIKVPLVKLPPKCQPIARILAAMDHMDAHTRLFVAVLVDTGLRPSEAKKITAEHLSDDGTIVVEAKGEEIRVVGLGRVAATACRAALAADPRAPLFPLHRWTYTYRIRAAGRKIGIHLNARIIRHSFTRNAFESGVDQPTIQKLLGHKKPAMTMHYGQVWDHTATRRQQELSPIDRAAMPL
jgi:integrase